MSELLFQIGVTKLALSLGLAGIALLVQRRLDRPAVSHWLWALVLAALLVPAVIQVPVPVLGQATVAEGSVPLPDAGVSTPAGGSSIGAVIGGVPGPVKTGLVVAWLLGSVVLLIWSLVRTLRFSGLLKDASAPATGELRRLVARTAAVLGLRRMPAVRTTRASLSPMVWWIGGEVRLLIPEALVTRIDEAGLQWILAHELAHVKRRDHVVRWIEWLACVAFWWNPVAWWTRRELRAAEEFCCDGLVLSALRGSPRAYGSSLVAVIDFLSAPDALRPPAFASAVDSGGRTTLIERRLRKIMTGTPIADTPRWLRLVLGIVALGAVSLGLINCGADADAMAPEDEQLEQVAERSGARALEENVFLHIDFDHTTLEDETACADCHVGGVSDSKAGNAPIGNETRAIRGAIEAGNLTSKEAALRFGPDSRIPSTFAPANGQRETGMLAEAAARIRAALEAGQITKQEAERQMRVFDARVSEDAARIHENITAAELPFGDIEKALKDRAAGDGKDPRRNQIKEKPGGN